MNYVGYALTGGIAGIILGSLLTGSYMGESRRFLRSLEKGSLAESPIYRKRYLELKKKENLYRSFAWGSIIGGILAIAGVQFARSEENKKVLSGLGGFLLGLGLTLGQVKSVDNSDELLDPLDLVYSDILL